jgi:hypothetical protein
MALAFPALEVSLDTAVSPFNIFLDAEALTADD